MTRLIYHLQLKYQYDFSIGLENFIQLDNVGVADFTEYLYLFEYVLHLGPTASPTPSLPDELGGILVPRVSMSTPLYCSKLASEMRNDLNLDKNL